MRLVGERSDGVQLVDLGAGQFVLLDAPAQQHSAPIVATDVDGFGPWTNPPRDRRVDQIARVLERARLVRRTWRLSADESFDDRRRQVDEDLRELLGIPGGSGLYAAPSMGTDFWVKDLGTGFVIYQIGGRDYKRPYTVGSDGEITFGDPAPVEQVTRWVPKTDEKE